jgi:DNA-binding CsgD family transcriptional regulator
MLVGREGEQGVLREVLDAAGVGRSSGVALRGEAGIGKTALLRWLRSEASRRGFVCLDTVGTGHGRLVPYAALTELLAPLHADLDELDEDGLLSALVATGGSATPQLVAATFLRAVAALAERSPVLVIADDAQWIDDASADALATLARRTEIDRVAVVVASRVPLAWWHPTGCSELHVAGLAERDALDLLGATAELQGDAARRCWMLTGGNPLALLALGPQWRDGAGGEDATLPERLREALDERLATVTGGDAVMLAVALDRTGDESVLRKAVPDWDGVVDLCLDQDILDRADGRLLFAHPLLRARVLDASTAAARRAMHAAIAEAADADPHRHARAWHLAESLVGPDEGVAELLTDAARDYRQSGAPREALGAFTRAARISVDPDRGADHLIDAADMAWFIGDHALVDQLLDDASSRSTAPAVRGRVAIIRGQQQTWQRGPLAAHDLLRREAGAIERDEPALAAACLGFATFSALVAMRIDLALEASERAVALAGAGDDVIALLGAHAARGSALVLAGRAAEADPFLEPVEQLALAAAETGTTDAEHLVQMVAVAHTYRERWDRARELLTGAIQRGRAAGALEVVAFGTGVLAEVSVRTGRWAEAYGLVRTVVDEEWGDPGVRSWPRAYLARVSAALGREDECRSEAAAALEVAGPRGLAVVEAWACAALGLLELGRDRPHAAVAHLDRVAELWRRGGIGEPGALWWEGDHLDALVACGDRGRAKELLHDLEREIDLTGRGYAVVVCARGRALLAPDDAAEALFADAVAAAEAFSSPFELARTLLARVRHRRRLGHAGATTDAERSAALFETLGAVDWARLARGREGEPGRVAPLDQLTASELRVAMAVARGLTNREASIDLCVSAKTVDYHLGNIYRKLGVRTRTEMTARLLGADPGQN